MTKSASPLEEKAASPPRREFSQEELLILRQNGITPAAAACLLSKSSEVFVSIRGNDSDKLPNEHRLSMSCYPKPGSIQAKSCNIGPANSYVAHDQRYSKAEQTPEGIKATPRKSGDFPEEQPTIAAPVSLQAVIAGIQSGEYELVEAEEGGITFKLGKQTLGSAPDEVKGDHFYILLDPIKRVKILDAVDKEALGIQESSILGQPDWWDKAELGSYDQVATYTFPLQMKAQGQDEFSDFKIAAESFDGELVPVIGDYDQFIVGVSDEYEDNIQAKMPEMNELIDAMEYKKDNVSKLVALREKLEIKLFEEKIGAPFNPLHNKEHAAFENEMDSRLMKGDFVKGKTTALKSYYTDQMNRLIKEAMPHVARVFPHSEDAYNPYVVVPKKEMPPIKIGTVVTMVNNTLEVHKGAEDIAKFLCERVLPKFKFDIHPAWDMQFFGKVVEKQMELGHRILPDVRNVYDAFRANQMERKEQQRGIVARAPSSKYGEQASQATESTLKKMSEPQQESEEAQKPKSSLRQ